MARTVVVKFNFNLNFGKQLKSIRKAVQNMDNDPGIISGNKD